MVVDDSSFQRSLLKGMVERFTEREVIQAESAEECFQLLGLHTPEQSPSELDLILLDFELPGMNGLDALLEIRADARYRELPIVIITASQEEATLERAFASGAVDFLGKPSKGIVFAARIRNVLRLKAEMDQRRERERELCALTHQLEEVNHELERMAMRDSLLGIANRRHFNQMLESEWRRCRRQRSPLSLILVDVDHFKKFNDTAGHLAGDDCLRCVARNLETSVHRAGDLVARYGGEEFAILLPHTPGYGGLHVGERMRANLEALAIPHPGCNHQPVTISIGVATCIPDGDDCAFLVQRADEALYSAKAAGRNRVVNWEAAATPLPVRGFPVENPGVTLAS